ncbi:MAG: hypothetical protein ACTHJ7_02960 [Candidatus Nitrosocosmicus sp.]
MHKRGILRETECNGWLQTIRTAFKEGTIGDCWKDSELEDWFDPEFQGFINNEILLKNKQIKGKLAIAK